MDTTPPTCPGCAERDVQLARLEANVAELEANVAELEAKVAELEARLAKGPPEPPSRPPSADPPWKPRTRKRERSGRKQGGQPGHARAMRPLVPQAELSAPPVDVVPAACRCCGEPLEGTDPAPLRHQVTELPPGKPIVTEHRLHQLECPRCRTRTRAKLPEGVPSGGFGPRLKATLAMPTGGLHLARRTACRAMHALFGTKVSLAMATKAEGEAARALATPLAGTARNLLALEPALWRHLGSEAVPPTNNAAERALRPAELLAWLANRLAIGQQPVRIAKPRDHLVWRVPLPSSHDGPPRGPSKVRQLSLQMERNLGGRPDLVELIFRIPPE